MTAQKWADIIYATNSRGRTVLEKFEGESKAKNEVQNLEKVAPCSVENSPDYLFDLIKLVLTNELVAKFRFDGEGIKVTFCNGNNLD